VALALNDFLLPWPEPESLRLSIGGACLCIALILLAFVGSAMGSKPESDEGMQVATNGKTLVGETALGNEAAEIPSVEPKEFSMFLHDGGLERERAALVARAAITKELRPLTGAAFAIAASFILGRTLGERP
jgi:hypothetical protein